MRIRGFGHVKARNIERARQQATELLAAFTGRGVGAAAREPEALAGQRAPVPH